MAQKQSAKPQARLLTQYRAKVVPELMAKFGKK